MDHPLVVLFDKYSLESCNEFLGLFHRQSQRWQQTYHVRAAHGKYISVYCNLANVRVNGGENIKTGDIIGDIEPDAKGGNPRMLFQIRKERQTLNPAEWLKL